MQDQFFLHSSPKIASCVSPLSSDSLMMTMALKSVLLCPHMRVKRSQRHLLG